MSEMCRVRSVTYQSSEQGQHPFGAVEVESARACIPAQCLPTLVAPPGVALQKRCIKLRQRSSETGWNWLFGANVCEWTIIIMQVVDIGLPK